MPQAPLEASIVKSILKYLNGLDRCCARKVYSGGMTGRGEPDIDCVINGRSVKLEVKRPGGPGPTKLQSSCMDKWSSVGAVVSVVRSVDDVRDVFRINNLIVQDA